MFNPRCVAGWVLVAAMAPLTLGLAQEQTSSKPLGEDRVVRLIELKIKDEVIASMIQKQGLGFTADAEALERLKKAGASDAVLEAVRKVGEPKPPAEPDKKVVTYQQVREMLELGVPEPEILERLKTSSPTAFQLGDKELEDLKKLGASEVLLKAMGSVRTAVDVSSEITNLAILLDCSGSMSEPAPQGPTKMDAAKRAAVALVQKVPENVRVAFVIYGHDRARECDAVDVARPLVPLDSKGRDELVKMIGRLRPEGSTPIALSLRTAGRELAKANGPSGLVLISDGKEMCGGDPVSEAATLARDLKLNFGVRVVGFGVKPDERQALEEIARAGKGKYYDAPTPAALRDVIQMLTPEIVRAAKPAPVGSTITLGRRGRVRHVTVQRPGIQLPPLGTIYLTRAKSVSAEATDYQSVARCTEYGRKMRIPVANKAETFDLWWVPKDKESMPVKMAANLSVPLDQDEVVVKPEEHLGLVRLNGQGLPATKQVFLGPPHYGQEVANAIGPHKLQRVTKYGQDLVIAAGTYNLWIAPVDEKNPEVVAEKIEVKPGQVTVIE